MGNRFLVMDWDFAAWANLHRQVRTSFYELIEKSSCWQAHMKFRVKWAKSHQLIDDGGQLGIDPKKNIVGVVIPTSMFISKSSQMGSP